MIRILLFFSFIGMFIPQLQAQKKFNRNVPNEAHVEMGKMLSSGISSFSFTPSGGWVLTSKTGGHFARNIPNECYDKIKEFIRKGHKIEQVVFHPKGGNSWLILTNKSKFARGIPAACNTKLDEYIKSGKKIKCVAFPFNKKTDDSWVIVTKAGGFFARNIPDECYQIMKNLRQSPLPGQSVPRKIHYVNFTPSNGWVVLAQDYFFTRNIPQDCFNQIKSMVGNKNLVDIAAFTPDGRGWSVISNSNFRTTPNDPIRQFENNVDGGSIWGNMRELNVPGVSVAVVINGQIAWKTGYGHLSNKNTVNAVHPETMFQAASISKVVAAVGAYKLVDQKLVTLDENLRASKKLSVSIPKHSCFKKYTDTKSVTVRNILNHQSGILGNGTDYNAKCVQNQDAGGYGGYAQSNSASKIPNINEIISGNAGSGKVSVNSDPITLTYNSSSLSGRSYSGPGFTILQKLTEDVSGQGYSTWMRNNVLLKMNMKKSRFTINPESIYKGNELTWGHYTNGNQVRNRYPEAAAAGLYTSAVELANLLITLNNNGNYGRTRVLTQANNTLLTQGTGANRRSNDTGVKSNNRSYYCHGGTNEGYRCFMVGFPSLNKGEVQSAGIVVMTNGSSSALRYDIVNAIVAAYGW